MYDEHWLSRHLSKILLFIAVYLIIRTFYEYNLMVIDSKQIHISTRFSSDFDLICPSSNFIDEGFLRNSKYSEELEAIRKERQELNSMITQLNKDYVSIHKFEVALKGVKDDRESYTGLLRDLLVTEFDLIQAERLGKPDYALKESVAHTPTHDHGGQIIRWKGLPLFFDPKTPDTVLSKATENVVPGDCWPFEGSIGYVLIELYRSVNVTSISYEHASMRLLPSDELRRAPKLIEIWVGQDENTNLRVGDFNFIPRDIGAQSYTLPKPTTARFVKFAVLDNYGDNLTCLYRIRVHGDPIKKS